jgi:hypothetical protein
VGEKVSRFPITGEVLLDLQKVFIVFYWEELGDKLETHIVLDKIITDPLVPFVLFGYYVTFNNTAMEVGIRSDDFVLQLAKRGKLHDAGRAYIYPEGSLMPYP